MIEKLKQFIKEAGQYSIEKRHAAEHQLSFKSGADAAKGIVTEVDIAISKMFREFVGANFADLNYMIIDEESIAELPENVFKLCERTDYQFVIDPIDGTMNYAADIPMYGITIAVMKKGKPWLGLLYAPVTGELVYTDGEKVFSEYNGVTSILPAGRESVSRVVLGHAWRISLKSGHFDGKLIMHDYFSAVIYCLYMALGRVKGAFMQANLWDIAGGWAICKLLGMGFYGYENGKEITAFTPEFFHENCRVKKMQILCFQRDYEMLKGLTLGIADKG